MISKASEDYLKAIYQLGTESGGVSTTLLAERLAVAPASVTEMLKKLAAQNLVAYTRYQGVVLTDAGRAVALRVLRYHRLAERYLSDVLGLSWDQVHAEAEEWEHVLSEQVAAAMDEAMGRPTTDPHGEPIPSQQGELPLRPDTPLARLVAQQAATVARVNSEDPELLRYLGSLRLYPGVDLVVLDLAPFDGPVTVEIDGRRHALGYNVAERIFMTNVHSSTVSKER